MTTTFTLATEGHLLERSGDVVGLHARCSILSERDRLAW